MISSLQDWQRALLEVVLIIILQRGEDRLNWLTSTFATLLNSEGSEGYWHLQNHLMGLQQTVTDCLVSLNAYYWWLNVDGKSKRGYSSQTAFMMIRHRLELIPAMRYVNKQRASQRNSDMLCRVEHSITFVVSREFMYSQHVPPPGLLIAPALLFIGKK